MFCSRCGHQLKDDASFCQSCGAPQPSLLSEGIWPLKAPQTPGLRWSHFPTKAAWLVIWVTAIVALYFWISSGDESRGQIGGRLAIAVVIVGGLLLWMISQRLRSSAGHPAVVADVLRSRTFEVMDATGALRGTLGVLLSGCPCLTLYDTAAKARVSLSLCSEGTPSLRLADATGALQANLAVQPNGAAVLGLHDKEGNARAGLCVLSDGMPMLSLKDALGKTRVSLKVDSDGEPAVALHDAAGETRADLSLCADVACLGLYDATRGLRANLSVCSTETRAWSCTTRRRR